MIATLVALSLVSSASGFAAFAPKPAIHLSALRSVQRASPVDASIFASLGIEKIEQPVKRAINFIGGRKGVGSEIVPCGEPP